MPKALKFIGFFTSVAAFILILIVGLNYHSFKSMFDNRYSMAEGSEWVEYTYSMSGLTRYISENSENVSMASIVIGDPEASVMLGENIPRPMGTLSNFFLLTGYANAFENGVIDPGRLLNWDDTSIYVLPQIGEAIHREAFGYGKDQGLIDDNDQLTVRNALRILSRFNSLALSDYLLTQLGEDYLLQHFEELGLEHTDLPLPFSGLFITLASSIQNTSSEQLMQVWREKPREALEREVYENTRKYAGGPERQEWQDILRKNRLGINFMQERDLLDLFPKTTAAEIANVLADMKRDLHKSPQAGEQVMEWLRYPTEMKTMARRFHEYGALYDNRVGLLNGLDIGISAETGETFVQALFFDQIHISVWFHMSSNHMHQDFQQRLIWDQDLTKTMKTALQS